MRTSLRAPLPSRPGLQIQPFPPVRTGAVQRVADFGPGFWRALADLFAEVLKLCDRAGLVKPGVVSIDGTRISGNASPEVNYQFEQIAREILAEAQGTDEAEDEALSELRAQRIRPESWLQPCGADP